MLPLSRQGARAGTAAGLLLLALTLAPTVAADDPDAEVPARRSWIGVILQDAVDGGVELVAIVPGGPADRAGLRRGDVVVRAGDARVVNVADLSGVLRSTPAGRPLPLQVVRAGRSLDSVVTPGSWPRSATRPPRPVAPPRAPKPPVPARVEDACVAYGLAVTEVTPDLRSHFGAPQEAGVLITGVAPERAAAAAGFRVGDILIRLGDAPVRQVLDVERLLADWNDPETPLEASLVRGGRPARVELRVGSRVEASAEAAAALAAQRAGEAPADDRTRVLIEEAVQAEIARLQERIRQLERELEAIREPR